MRDNDLAMTRAASLLFVIGAIYCTRLSFRFISCKRALGKPNEPVDIMVVSGQDLMSPLPVVGFK